MTEPSVFTQIINRELPATIHYEDEQCIVISDINPKAPIHLLIIPKEPIVRLAHAEKSHQSLLGHLLLVAGDVAREKGVGEAFRMIVNSGKGAGELIPHLHLHLLAGKDLSKDELGFDFS